MEKTISHHNNNKPLPLKGGGTSLFTTRHICSLFSRLLTSVTIATNCGWILVWMVLSMVEGDVKDDVNLFFVRELKLTKLVDIFSILKYLHLSLIAVSFSAFMCYMCCTNLYSFCFIQVINIGVTLYNIGFFHYVISTGYIVWHLFLLSFPLLTVRFFYHNSVVIFLIVSAWALFSWCKVKQVPRNRCSCRIIYSLVVMLMFVSAIVFLVRIGCYSCDERRLSMSKPSLTAHRGCPSALIPENSLIAFEKAASIPGVVTLESDVRISQDGVVFLLHDDTLFRTTSFPQTCPSLSPLTSASSLNYYSGQCPLKNLSLIEDPSQHIPTLKEYLTIAKKYKKNVIFDVNKPNNDYSTNYVDYILQAVVESKIDLNKVWWLEGYNRSVVSATHPQLTLAAKSGFTSFKQFRKNNISIANEHWSTTGNIIKRLQRLQIAINMYRIDSVILYEYAWCLGVETVTTDNCHELSNHKHNYLDEACHSILLATPWLLLLIIALLCLSILTI